MTARDVEYLEVRFDSEASLEAARKVIVIKAELGMGGVLVSTDMMSEEDVIEAVGLIGMPLPDIRDSGIYDDDMWPEWPEDTHEEAEASFVMA
jgi:hypothetical protein